MAVTPIYNLFYLQTTDATGAAINRPMKPSDPRRATIFVEGTYDGATIQIEESPDGVLYNPIPDCVFTNANNINKVVESYLPYLRAVQSGSGASTSLSCGVM